MSVRDLIPWGRGSNGNKAPSLYRGGEQSPFLALHREMNRLFDDFFRDFDSHLPALGSASNFMGWPSVEISEDDRDIKVTAEVPGLEEKDIEVLLDNGVLTLRGEKRSETEDKDRQFSERYYGRFERLIPVGPEIEEDKVDATFKNGVLTVTLPKTAKAQSQVRRIAVKS
jgi:HSP20 family protein